MNDFRDRTIFWIAILSISLSLLGCGGGDDDADDPPPEEPDIGCLDHACKRANNTLTYACVECTGGNFSGTCAPAGENCAGGSVEQRCACMNHTHELETSCACADHVRNM